MPTTDPTLEARLAAAVDDPTAWQVYADWLIEHGERWGEVIAAEGAGKDTTARRAEVLALGQGVDGLELEWQHGVLCAISFTPEEEPAEEQAMHLVLGRLLSHPAGRLVRRLTLGLPVQPAGDIEWNFDAVLAGFDTLELPLLEVLDLTPDAQHMDQDSWRRLGDFEPVWRCAPRLKELRAKGSAGSDSNGPQLRFGAIAAPALQRLVIESSGLAVDAVVDLGSATLPALVDLELWFGQENYGLTATVDSLAGILSGAGLPALTRLALKNSEWETELIDAVAASPLLSRLEVLDLSMGILCTEGAQALVARAARFKHLKQLVLDDNYLLDDQQAALRAALPNVELGTQREPDGAPDDEYSRYVSAGE